jgi:hypothetical protein
MIPLPTSERNDEPNIRDRRYKSWQPFWQRALANGYFNRFRKSYLAETTSLLKLSPQAIRKELSQKMRLFPFIRSARVREKQLNAAWKIYVSVLLNAGLMAAFGESAHLLVFAING